MYPATLTIFYSILLIVDLKIAMPQLVCLSMGKILVGVFTRLQDTVPQDEQKNGRKNLPIRK